MVLNEMVVALPVIVVLSIEGNTIENYGHYVNNKVVLG